MKKLLFTTLIILFVGLGAVKANNEHKGRTENTHLLHEVVVSDGRDGQRALEIINACKQAEKPGQNALYCVLFASSIGTQESGRCKITHNNGCFGVKLQYRDISHSIKDWAERRATRWRKHRTADEYLDRSFYCGSELQPDGRMLGYCPIWRRSVGWMINNKQKKLLEAGYPEHKIYDR